MDDVHSISVLDGIIGHCVGDALGVPVEFSSRDELLEYPVKTMRGYGRYHQPPGTWSDDSSLTFCLMESLCHGLDYQDIANSFLKWFDEGYWAAHDYVFDIGKTTKNALERIRNGVNPLQSGGKDEYDNGNGSLMRILPLLYYLLDVNSKEKIPIIHNISSITHAHPRSHIACAIYVHVGHYLLIENDKIKAYEKMKQTIKGTYTISPYQEEVPNFKRILDKDISSLPKRFIKSDGYVVNTLEAVLWCFLNSVNYKDAVLKAVNLGGDTDTIAAITGGLAGLHYGYTDIPTKWIDNLARKQEIIDLCLRFERKIKKTTKMNH